MRVTIPMICLRGLSYLYLAFVTLVVHLLFLIHLCSYFLNILSECHMVCVHFERFIGLLWIIVRV